MCCICHIWSVAKWYKELLLVWKPTYETNLLRIGTYMSHDISDISEFSPCNGHSEHLWWNVYNCVHLRSTVVYMYTCHQGQTLCSKPVSLRFCATTTHTVGLTVAKGCCTIGSCAYIAYEAVLVIQSAGEPENRKEPAFSGWYRSYRYRLVN